MKVTWLGQAGLYFEADNLSVMIDPYLSDSVGKVNPANHRRVPVKEELFDLCPDVMIFTHDHLDHYDPETAERFFAKAGRQMIVLCPGSVWPKARVNGNGHNYVLFDRGAEWTEGNVRFTAVRAAHSDACAIGVIIEDMKEGKRYYITGDTLYHQEILADVPAGMDAIFLPVNGVGNNMNMTDAARLCEKLKPAQAVPMHCGLFDGIDMNEFAYENKVVPAFYETINLK